METNAGVEYREDLKSEIERKSRLSGYLKKDKLSCHLK